MPDATPRRLSILALWGWSTMTGHAICGRPARIAAPHVPVGREAPW